MAITLHPDHERLVTEAIETGAYAGADDVIGRALELLRSEEHWLHDQRAVIHEKIERAFGQFERVNSFLPRNRGLIWRSARVFGWHSRRGEAALSAFCQCSKRPL